MTRNKILITGSGGFLGKALINHLNHSNEYEILRADKKMYDLMNLADCHKLTANIDIIIHTSGLVLSRVEQQRRPAEVFNDNVIPALNIVNAAGSNGVKRVCLFGSLTAYPDKITSPFNENDLWNGPVPDSNYAYGAAKRLMNTIARAFSDQYETEVTCFILPNLYGPGDKFSFKPPPLVPNLIKTLYKAKQDGSTIIEGGDNGKCAIELLYVDDAVEALLQSLQHYNLPATLNIGTGVPVTIEEIAGIIAKHIGYTGIINWSDATKTAATRYLDIELAKNHLNWQARHSLSEGLKKTVDYFLKHETN